VPPIRPLHELDPTRFETPEILKQVVRASRALADLKGRAASIPNEAILISSLTLQEAKDSSEIESIVTTHDEIFMGSLPSGSAETAAAKEVRRYGEALRIGFEAVRRTGLLTLGTVLEVQERLESNRAGLRRVPGTELKDGAGNTVYLPPQDANEVQRLVEELVSFWHGKPPFDADPLIRMALIHHQFESIHPFYDGNGRTGRIINLLYLVKEGLLDIPVLYMSREILRTKPEYYRLLQAVRDPTATRAWEEWVLYILAAVERTAIDSLAVVVAIGALLLETKHRIRDEFRFYSQDLINNLFSHPYTRIEHVVRDLGVTRLTATKYLDALAENGVLVKRKIGRSSYYINGRLCEILRRSG